MAVDLAVEDGQSSNTHIHKKWFLFPISQRAVFFTLNERYGVPRVIQDGWHKICPPVVWLKEKKQGYMFLPLHYIKIQDAMQLWRVLSRVSANWKPVNPAFKEVVLLQRVKDQNHRLLWYQSVLEQEIKDPRLVYTSSLYKPRVFSLNILLWQ